MKYSQSTDGWYPDNIPYAAGSIPADAVETTTAFQQQWFAAPAGSTLSVVDGVLTINPPAPITLAQAQAAQVAALNSAYQAAITAPVTFTTAAGATADFPQTAQARDFMAQSVDAGAAAWTLNLWMDVNNAPVTPFTFADLEGLSATMAAADAPDYQDFLAKVADVTSATTVSAVEAVTF